MVLPNLIDPIDITIEQIDRTATIMDPDAREPLQHADRSTTISLKGQPRFRPAPGGPGASFNLSVFGQGPSEQAIGYVTFRQYDLDNYPGGAVTLQIGDRITMQGHLAEEYYIVRFQPRGHYADQNGASLLKAWFSDRKPAKERAS